MNKLLFIIVLSVLTILFHYMYGMSHTAMLEAVHRRLCYIPIVLGGLWFGVYGGVATAAGISLAVVPFIYMHRSMGQEFIPGEIVEIIFYGIIGWLTGMLSDAQKNERKQNDVLKEQLRTSERLSTIGELFAYMMHEIRNPLSSIKGAADIVADQSVNPERKLEFAGLLKSEISRLNRTLDSMLSYTRMKLEPEECNINAEIGKIIGLLNGQAEKNGVKINLFSKDDVVVRVDCDKMRQVFINLILNAIEAMPSGGKLDIVSTGTDNTYREILFKDTGPGIKPEQINSLFKPLFTTKKTGSGLGLAISKRIVEEHKGKLLVRSELGRGAVFTVRIPCNQ